MARGPKQQLLTLGGEDPVLSAVQVRLRAGQRAVLGGLVPGAKALYLLHLRRLVPGPLLVVTPDERRALDLVHHLRALAALLDGEEPPSVLPFPDLAANPYEAIAPHFQAMAERVAALRSLRCPAPPVLVAPAAALLYPLPHPDDFARLPFLLRRGERADVGELAARLQRLGYQRLDLVGQAGEFAVRGGVLDVYPPLYERPRRLEFLGEEIESIRRFDPETQRSSDDLQDLEVPPIREFGWEPEQVEALARRLEGRPAARRRVEEAVEALRIRGGIPGMEACAGLVSRARYDLFDHAPEGGLVVDEPFLTRAALEGTAGRLGELHEASDGLFPGPEQLLNPVGPLLERLGSARLAVAELAAEEDPEVVIPAASAAVRNYAGKMTGLVDDLRRQTAAGGRVLLLVPGAGRAQRLREILADYEIIARDAEAAGDGDEPAPGIYLGHAAMEGGFELRERRLLLLTEHEIFGEEVRHRPPRRARLAAFASDFRDLRPGDFVVHVDHGIGRFEGTQTVARDGSRAEMMVVAYKGGDRLFVPLDRLDQVQKYSGVRGAAPAMDRLGSTAWQKTRGRVRKAVQDMTAELLELYARRKAARGFAFSPDTEWQREMEDAFEYRETPDQSRAIAEVKADMEAERPMDRLLCGDVGYGKTEVAMRAAFKAVQDGKQVAVLAPTTVLAFQHLRTFRQRLASFPVTVEMVSRFSPRRMQGEILARAAAGKVDILVGTHRLLSRDVRFHDLGLLIVDEEQRFGVVHKERIKQMRMNIDVLSMSATPIPRTLQMSLAGVRDMSIIETAPENRLAIQTVLAPFRESVIASAIRQELRREGQIYFVHNRIESIDSMAALIRRLVPECRPVVAHGQMSENALERTMLSFLGGEHDVLVTTTIIENGLDLPRVNTLLVNRADRFGLSQLYQLRGRIGRSDRKAYAYLMVPVGGVHHPLARRRLAALQEFSDLGSGFRIAALDLELRGAGSLLGAQQHGHIAAIGFEMYCQMLERAVRQMEGEPEAEVSRPTLNLGVDIRLPESFIQESNQRLMFYKRIASASDEEDLRRIRTEMEDRYGHLPPQGDSLFRLAALRLLAERLGVRSVEFAEGALAVKLSPTAPVDPERLVAILAERPEASLTTAGVLRLERPGPPASRVQAAAELLLALGGCGTLQNLEAAP